VDVQRSFCGGQQHQPLDINIVIARLQAARYFERIEGGTMALLFEVCAEQIVAPMLPNNS
jgi:hypothetical protein